MARKMNLIFPHCPLTTEAVVQLKEACLLYHEVRDKKYLPNQLSLKKEISFFHLRALIGN